VRHVTLRDFPANDRAGDHFAVILHGRNNHDLESAVCAQLLQQFHVSRLLVAEMKVLANQNGFHTKITDKDLLHKFLGREACEIQGERQNHRGFDAERIKPFHALRDGG